MAKLFALATAFAGWAALAQDDDPAPKNKPGSVCVRLDAVRIHASSDLARWVRAGVRVEINVSGKDAPSAYELRDLLDEGANVAIDTDSYDAYDLRRLGGRRGRAKVVVSTRKYYPYELRWMVEEGVDLEIRTDHFSAHDLERIAGR